MAKPKGDHPKRVGPAARRRLVLAAAAGLFRRRGYRAVTVEQIAEAAGVKPELLAKWFADTEHLALARRFTWRWVTEIFSLAVSLSGIRASFSPCVGSLSGVGQNTKCDTRCCVASRARS